MTELIINNTPAILSENFSVTVKRENSIITKNGEYTYDCVLKLDNATNRQLYGFLHRLNKKGEVNTKRSATLIADGHVYCRGTEIITGWTDKEVSIQIVSGNSELNYFINSDELVSSFTGMGEIQGTLTQNFIVANNPVYPDIDFTLPTIRDSSTGNTYNQWRPGPILLGGSKAQNGTTLRAQPYLLALIRRLITAMGYTIGVNQLETTWFRYVFIVNTNNTMKYCEMLPGWTAKEFLEEVEKLCNCVFAVDNTNKTVDIKLKSRFYAGARIVPLYKVVDEYQAEVIDPEPEYSTSDLVYQFESGKLQRLQDCEDMLTEVERIDCEGLLDVIANLSTVQPTDKKMACDTQTGKYYIRITNPIETQDKADDNLTYIEEVNIFAPLRRNPTNEEAENVVEIGIVPVPMVCGVWPNSASYMEMAVINTGEYIKSNGGTFGGSFGGSSGSSNDDTLDDGLEMEALLMAGKEKKEEAKVQLYAALYNGYHKERNGWICSCYTDMEHAVRIAGLRYMNPMPWDYNYPTNGWSDLYEGSLDLKLLDLNIYTGAYTIDTKKSVTFTTFDKIVANPRQVLNIHNKLWIIREIEETFNAHGRKPSWKITCHPINITATQQQIEWVLEDGTWNDKNAWFDLGKWNDEPTV